MQTLFLEWLATRDVGLALRLLEQTHDKEAYNLLFDQQLSDLLSRVDKPAERTQLVAMLNFDWIGDIERALRRAGFGNETDELAHDIVVKLLVTPGGLFAGWRGQPMEGRFRASTKNAIVSLIQKRANRRRHFPTVSMHPGVASMDEPDNSLVQEFIDFLRERHGELAARVFQHRLAGGQTHELFGRVQSRHAIKLAVKDIKTAAKEFAIGDQEFQKMVEKAFAGEKKTVGRRRAAVAKR